MGLFSRAATKPQNLTPESFLPFLRLWVRPHYSLFVEQAQFQHTRGVVGGTVPHLPIGEHLVGLYGIELPQGENVLCQDVIAAWGVEGAHQHASENELSQQLIVKKSKLPGCLSISLANGEVPSVLLSSERITQGTFGDRTIAVMPSKRELYVLDAGDGHAVGGLNELRNRFASANNDGVSPMALSLAPGTIGAPFEPRTDDLGLCLAQSTAIKFHQNTAYMVHELLFKDEKWFQNLYRYKANLVIGNGMANSFTTVGSSMQGLIPKTDSVRFVNPETNDTFSVEWSDMMSLSGHHFTPAPTLYPTWSHDGWPADDIVSRLRNASVHV